MGTLRIISGGRCSTVAAPKVVSIDDGAQHLDPAASPHQARGGNSGIVCLPRRRAARPSRRGRSVRLLRPACWDGVEPIRLAAAFSPDPVPHLGVMIHDVSRDRLILMTLVVVAAGVAAYWEPATDEQDHLRDSRT